MSTRGLSFAIDEFYHIYNRGVDKRTIFLEDPDYKRFTRLLYLCNGSIPIEYRKLKGKSLEEIDVGEKLVAIGAYCLMPNHFHILVKEIHENGTSKFMGKLLTAYSSYFNKKYDRTGTLFGSQFKAEHLNSDEYLKYIYSYIHLNPAKLKDPFWRESVTNRDSLMEFINSYPYSSHSNYKGINNDEARLIINKEVFPAYFDDESYQRELWEWLNFTPEVPHNDLPRGGLGKTVDNSI